MRERRFSSLTFGKILRIGASLLCSAALFCTVFLGLFDFRMSMAELLIACAFSAYGIGELLFTFLSHKKKPSGGRIFLAVFSSILLLYVFAVLLMIYPERTEESGSEIVSVEAPSEIISDYKEEEKAPAYAEAPSAEEAPAEETQKGEDVKLPAVPSVAAAAVIAEEEYEEYASEPETVAETQSEPKLPDAPSVAVSSAPEADAYEEAVPAMPVFMAPLAVLSSDVSVPAVPRMLPVISDISEAGYAVPSAPLLYAERELADSEPEAEEEWFVQESDDDDFWADFYIAGEDDLLFDDGIYYFDLYINGSSAGSAEVFMENGIASIYAEDLRGYVDGYITDEADSRIFRGEEYLSEELLYERGVDVEVSADEYMIWVSFSPDDMPLQRISLTGSRYSRSARNITGSELLEPAVFTLATRYSLSAGFSILPVSSFGRSLNATLSTSNTFRLYDVNGSFMMSLRYYMDTLSFSFGGLNFYYTIPEKMMRLSWGSVAPDLLYASGTSIGFRLDNSISYADETAKRPTHIEKIISVEKDSDVQVLNEGKEIFRRTLAAGKYSLSDFTLYSGANRIKIIITPLDGSPAEEYEFDVNYSSALLAPGEFYYGAAAATGVNKVSVSDDKKDTVLRMPWFNGYSYDWDIRNIALSAYIKAGLSKTLTMNGTVAASNALSDVSWFMPKFKGSFEFTHANSFGAARYNLNLGTSRNSKESFTLPSVYFKAAQQFSTNWKPVSGISLSGSYSLSEQAEFKDWGSASAQLGLSGSIGIIGWNISGNASIPLIKPETYTWAASSSLSANISRNLSLSASGSFYSTASHSVAFSGRISASVQFSPVRANASYSAGGLSVSLSGSDSRNSVSLNMDTPDPEKFNNYSFSADYSHTGNYLGFSARTSASSGFRTMSASLSLSASSVFADGVFAFTQSSSSNFVLIKQKGILRGNVLTAGAIGTSNPSSIPKSFGVGVYNGIPSGGNTSFTIFSTSRSSFGTASAFSYALPASSRNGYVVTLTAESTYSVAGYVKRADDTVWINGSSPLYKASVRKDGSVALEMTDEYLFTDSDGLFIVSGISSGLWAFDAEIDGTWYQYIFTVEDNPSHAVDILVLSASALSSDIKAEAPYSAVYEYSADSKYMSGEEFWDRLYSGEEDL